MTKVERKEIEALMTKEEREELETLLREFTKTSSEMLTRLGKFKNGQIQEVLGEDNEYLSRQFLTLSRQCETKTQEENRDYEEQSADFYRSISPVKALDLKAAFSTAIAYGLINDKDRLNQISLGEQLADKFYDCKEMWKDIGDFDDLNAALLDMALEVAKREIPIESVENAEVYANYLDSSIQINIDEEELAEFFYAKGSDYVDELSEATKVVLEEDAEIGDLKEFARQAARRQSVRKQ